MKSKIVVGAGLAAALIGMGQTAPAPAVKVPFTISKETTAVTGPLRADGTVDYVGAMNAKYGAGVKPEENGFVLWLEVMGTGDRAIAPSEKSELLKMCGGKETAAGAEVWEGFQAYIKREKGTTDEAAGDLYDDELRGGQRKLWKAEDHPDLAAFLKKSEKLLAIATEAMGRPKWWIPMVSSDGTLIGTLLPGLGSLRDVGNTLCARAMLRLGSGDVEGCFADIATVRRMARHVASGWSLIERLVGVALDAQAMETLGAAAASGTLTVEQAKRAMKELGDFGPMPSLVESAETGERWMALDMAVAIERMLAGGNAAKELKELDGINLVLVQKIEQMDKSNIDWNVVLKTINEQYDRLVAALKPDGVAELHMSCSDIDRQAEQWTIDPDQLLKPGQGREANSENMAYLILAIVFPDLERAELLHRQAAQEVEMVRVLLGAAQVKARTGKWPATQEELAPGILKELPKDMYSEGGKSPFHYLLKENGPRVYSVGRNGKDDGGVRDSATGKDDVGVGAG